MARGIVIPVRHRPTDTVHWALWNALCIDTTACGQRVQEEELTFEKADAVLTCVVCMSLSTRRA